MKHSPYCDAYTRAGLTNTRLFIQIAMMFIFWACAGVFVFTLYKAGW